MKVVDRRTIDTARSLGNEVAVQRIARTVASLLVAAFIVSGCSGGLDGPVVEGNRTSGAQDAEIFGEVVVESECIYLLQTEVATRYPVIWPHGTEWNPDQSAVVLPDGTLVSEGIEVYGDGGYQHTDDLSDDTTSEGIALVSSCVDNEYDEVAVFNSSGEIEIRS